MRRLSDEQVNLVSRRGRALGDPTRVRILEVLGRTEQPVGQIAAALHLQPSTISKHLQVLYHAGMVDRRRSASEVIYSLVDPELLELCRYLGTTRTLARVHRS